MDVIVNKGETSPANVIRYIIKYGNPPEMTFRLSPELRKLPVGSVLMHAGFNLPPGFLLCGGQELEYEYYPELYEAIGRPVVSSALFYGRKVCFRAPTQKECEQIYGPLL